MEISSFYSPVTLELLAGVADHEEQQSVFRQLAEEDEIARGNFSSLSGKFDVDGNDVLK